MADWPPLRPKHPPVRYDGRVVTLLDYESSSKPALLPDEKLAWQSPPARTRLSVPWLWTAAVLGVISPFMAIPAYRSDSIILTVPAVLVIVAAVAIVVIIVLEWRTETRAAATGHCRITNLRVQAGEVANLTKPAVATIDAVRSFRAVPFRGAVRVLVWADPDADENTTEATCAALIRAEDVGTFASALLTVLVAQNRKRDRRRPNPLPDRLAPMPTPRLDAPADPAQHPAVGLLPGEEVLWQGRPQPKELDIDTVKLALKTVLLLMIPACVIAGWLGAFGPRLQKLDGVWTFIISLWLFQLLYLNTIAQFIATRRLDRTHYVLTPLRWITWVEGRKPETDSILLDVVRSVQWVQHPKGGSIRIDDRELPGVIPDAEAVHAMLLRIIPRPPTTPEPLDPAESAS